MIYSWRISFTAENPTTRDREKQSVVLRAPTAADALTMFGLNDRIHRISKFGAEWIEVVEKPDGEEEILP